MNVPDLGLLRIALLYSLLQLWINRYVIDTSIVPRVNTIEEEFLTAKEEEEAQLGPPGDQGPQGDPGPQGSNGPQGPQGPPGVSLNWNSPETVTNSALNPLVPVSVVNGTCTLGTTPDAYLKTFLKNTPNAVVPTITFNGNVNDSYYDPILNELYLVGSFTSATVGGQSFSAQRFAALIPSGIANVYSWQFPTFSTNPNNTIFSITPLLVSEEFGRNFFITGQFNITTAPVMNRNTVIQYSPSVNAITVVATGINLPATSRAAVVAIRNQTTNTNTNQTIVFTFIVGVDNAAILRRAIFTFTQTKTLSTDPPPSPVVSSASLATMTHQVPPSTNLTFVTDLQVNVFRFIPRPLNSPTEFTLLMGGSFTFGAPAAFSGLGGFLALRGTMTATTLDLATFVTGDASQYRRFRTVNNIETFSQSDTSVNFVFSRSVQPVTLPGAIYQSSLTFATQTLSDFTSFGENIVGGFMFIRRINNEWWATRTNTNSGENFANNVVVLRNNFWVPLFSASVSGQFICQGPTSLDPSVHLVFASTSSPQNGVLVDPSLIARIQGPFQLLNKQCSEVMLTQQGQQETVVFDGTRWLATSTNPQVFLV